MQNKKNKKLSVSFILLVFIIIQLSACDNNEHRQQLNSYVANLKNITANKKPIMPIKLRPPMPFVYQAQPLRAPFMEKQNRAITRLGSSNPLLIYPLSMLKFKGTILECNKSFAYILAPDNKLYLVKAGDMLGDHRGKVNHIYPNQILVLERDFEAGKPTVQHVVKLQLRDNQE